jgi:DNA-binding NarL/FixJ family response regulator
MPRHVLSAVEDLFFITRIRAVADQIGVALETCPLEQILERSRSARPDLVILDLHAPGDPLAAVRALKSDAATAPIPVLGFHSHVDIETRRRAIEAGVDRVMPRSAFSSKLAAILAGSP